MKVLSCGCQRIDSPSPFATEAENVASRLILQMPESVANQMKRPRRDCGFHTAQLAHTVRAARLFDDPAM